MAENVTVVRKWATLVFVVVVAFGLKTQVFAMSDPVNAYWMAYDVHENASCDVNMEGSKGLDWGWDPCGEGLWCETLYHYAVNDCWDGDTFACEDDEWLALDFAWACGADCADNVTRPNFYWQNLTHCDFDCTCEY